MSEPLATPLDLIPLSQDPAEIDGPEPFAVNGNGSELDTPWLGTGDCRRVSPLLGEDPISRIGECCYNPRPPGSQTRSTVQRDGGWLSAHASVFPVCMRIPQSS